MSAPDLFTAAGADAGQPATALKPVAEAAMQVQLRDYQLQAVEQAREAIRNGARNVLIVAPTGSGKTIVSAYLIESNRNKGKRSNFIVDRISLVQQTSDTFDRYGINHGIMQADHWRYRPEQPTQLVSVGTARKRGFPDSHLDIIDEAHTIDAAVKARLEERARVSIGLTATPFTKGLGQLYEAVINVTTTHALIEQGFLVPYRIFACTEPDMGGVSVKRSGEWDDKEASDAALQVVGDVVEEYLKRGEGRKFICSAVDTAHVNELARQFLAAGINVATYTYKDQEEDRAETVNEFRKPTSTIRGLITVTAASKGFDVPDIGCVIVARPLRKSLAEFIQFLGRGLRIFDGKTDCIVLDHSGNTARFWKPLQQFFEHGALDLSKAKKAERTEAQEQEVELVTCGNCSHMHRYAPACPQCGHEYPRKKAIEHVPGTLKEILATKNASLMKRELWPQVVDYVLKNTPRGDADKLQRKAQALYRDLTGEWAMGRVSTTRPVTCSPELAGKLRAKQIRFAHGKGRGAAAPNARGASKAQRGGA